MTVQTEEHRLQKIMSYFEYTDDASTTSLTDVRDLSVSITGHITGVRNESDVQNAHTYEEMAEYTMTFMRDLFTTQWREKRKAMDSHEAISAAEATVAEIQLGTAEKTY